MNLADCDSIRARVSAELDGELSSYESSLLERHLVGCPACAAFASDMGRYTELLRSAPLEQPPALSLAPPRRRGALRFSAGVGAAVASTAAAALVALSFTKPGNHERAVALSLAPSTAVVERVQGGIVGLRHPTAPQSQADPRPTLGLPQVSARQDQFDRP